VRYSLCDSAAAPLTTTFCPDTVPDGDPRALLHFVHVDGQPLEARASVGVPDLEEDDLVLP
jgi:hypothetical protein